MNTIQLESYSIHPKERAYFAVRVFFSGLVYAVIIAAVIATFRPLKFTVPIILIYITLIITLSIWLKRGILVGLIKANSIKLNKNQLPEIFQIVEDYCQQLNIQRIPSVYLLESGGLLNAFATKLLYKNYIVIYSDLLEEYYEGNPETLEFVIAHELGHIKRNHLNKEIWLFPSALIPFLALAYSRGCELTCDNIGKALSPKGAVRGILTLSGGKKLKDRINPEEFIAQKYNDKSFWRWLIEKLSAHPNLYKRMALVYDKNEFQKIKVQKKPDESPVLTKNITNDKAR